MHLLSFLVCLATLASAVVFNGPVSTTAGLITHVAWQTPAPIPVVRAEELRRRLTDAEQSAQICGYVSGIQSSLIECGTGSSCALNPPWMACCTNVYSNCNGFTSCIDYSSYSACGSACQSRTGDLYASVLLCSNSASQFCNTWSYPEASVISYGCGTNSASTPTLMSLTYSGQTGYNPLIVTDLPIPGFGNIFGQPSITVVGITGSSVPSCQSLQGASTCQCYASSHGNSYIWTTSCRHTTTHITTCTERIGHHPTCNPLPGGVVAGIIIGTLVAIVPVLIFLTFVCVIGVTCCMAIFCPARYRESRERGRLRARERAVRTPHGKLWHFVMRFAPKPPPYEEVTQGQQGETAYQGGGTEMGAVGGGKRYSREGYVGQGEYAGIRVRGDGEAGPSNLGHAPPPAYTESEEDRIGVVGGVGREGERFDMKKTARWEYGE